jgi:hypothetical protein
VFQRRSLAKHDITAMVLFAALIAAIPTESAAQPSTSLEATAADTMRATNVKNVYCGVVALYAAARLLGRQPRAADMILNSEYVVSERGSSLGQLQAAATELGLESRPVSHLSGDYLRSSEQLVILHLREHIGAEEFNHYELYVGECDGKAMLFDSLQSTHCESYSELESRMSGNGLVVSNRPITLAPNVISGSAENTRRIAMIAASLFFGILGVLALRGKRNAVTRRN